MPDRSNDPPRLGQRIVVIGNTNAGKSTLAARLAEHIGGDHIELDALFWRPGWTEAPTEEFRADVTAAIQAERWVSSGNYLGRHRLDEVSWPLADQVIWLDMPLRTVLPRVVRRSWRRYRNNELLWGTNRERFWEHLKLWDPESSLIAFAITADRTKRKTYAARMHEPRLAHVDFIRLRSPKAVDRWTEAAIAATPAAEPHDDADAVAD